MSRPSVVNLGPVRSECRRWQTVDDVKQDVSKAEASQRFRIVPGVHGNGELTPTQKLRREHVLTKYAADVEALDAGSHDDG